MAVPKHRTSKQKKRQRRSHQALTPKSLVACTNCGLMRQTHRVCGKCGYFRKQAVLKIKSTKSKN